MATKPASGSSRNCQNQHSANPVFAVLLRFQCRRDTRLLRDANVPTEPSPKRECPSWEHHMRYVTLAIALLIPLQSSRAAVAPEIDPSASLGVVQQWIYNYRAKPDYAHVPAAVRVLFHSQTFKEPENAGIYLGFIAGAIASNPAKAESLINSFFPVPAEDEWVIGRAIPL